MLNQKAQTILEYVMLFTIVVMALIAMRPMLQRGTQDMIKVVADQIGAQNESEQKITDTSGYLVSQFSSSRFDTRKTLVETPGGMTDYYHDDTVWTTGNITVNMGFTNRAS